MPFSTYVSGLTFAFGITFDRNNNLYIATGPANNIIKVDTSGNQSVFAAGFNFTQNVVFDNAGFPGGYLYVMDSTNTIYKVDAAGTVTTFVTNLNTHYFGMAFDSHNNLYYSSVDNNRIYKIDPSGITSIFINGAGVLSYPTGLTFDTAGNLFIANGSNQYICKYDSSGNLVNAKFISFPGNTWFNLIIDANNNIYANTFTYLNKYDSDGNLISTIYNDPTGSINGLAFDSIGNLYFTSDNNTAIIQFTNATPPISCFKEDTKILTNNGYVPVQHLRKGDLVKTLNHWFVPIHMIGYQDIYNTSSEDHTEEMLYKCSQDKYPELLEDLIMTGHHSILIHKFKEGERSKTEKVLGRIYLTDDKARLPVCVDSRATPYKKEGTYTVYHFSLEHDNDYMNYGVYANGLLVESSSKRYLRDLSNMIMID